MPDITALILDRNAARTAVVARGLSAGGATSVRVLAPGDAAVALVRRTRARIVVLAPSGPGMDGPTMLRRLSDVSEPAFFVLASPADVEDALDAIELGASAVLASDASGGWQEAAIARVVRAELGGASPLVWNEETPPTGTPVDVGRVRGGRLGALRHDLRHTPPGRHRGRFITLDVPPWMVGATADRLHGSTPWRVLRARPGDVVAARHAFLCAESDGMALAFDSPRPRIVLGSPAAACGTTPDVPVETRRSS